MCCEAAVAGQSLESCAALQREGEDLEIPGAFLEGGAEEDKKGEAGEGRDESAGWLGGNLGVRRGGGKVLGVWPELFYLFMFLMKLFTLR